MRAFYHPDQAIHNPLQFMRYGRICDATDVPARTEELLKALSRLGVTPEINAVCTLMIAIVAGGVLAASIVNKRREVQRQRDEQAALRG